MLLHGHIINIPYLFRRTIIIGPIYLLIRSQQSTTWVQACFVHSSPDTKYSSLYSIKSFYVYDYNLILT